MNSAGFRELEHTADWELQVWAPDLEGLFAQAALGMNSLSGMQLAAGPRIKRSIELREQDDESLLVAFLQEILFWAEQDVLGFDAFDLDITPGMLRGTISGAPILHRDKEIKAVTYHNLRLERTPKGLNVNLVFDV